MFDLGIGFAVSAFVAGIVMFLAPCTLPMVPAYLGFISGVSGEDAQTRAGRKKIFRNGLFFIGGFTIIFVLFGTLAGLLGGALDVSRVWLSRIGGVFVILFGLYLLGVFRAPFLAKERRLNIAKFLPLGKYSSSFLIGGAFAFGWTPCVGPILSTILLLASTSQTALSGGVLLFIFSLGLAVPFLFVAGLYAEATKYISRITGALRAIELIGAIFLIFLGVLLLVDQFDLLIAYGFRLFDGFNYESIYRFL